MNSHSIPAVGIQAQAPLSEGDFKDLFAVLDEHGISHTFEQREPQLYASLDWLIATAIVLFVTKSYFDGIFKEIGKEHYHWAKNALGSLFGKLFGKNPEITYQLVSAGKLKEPSYFSGAMSFVYVNRQGSKVKLLFPLDVTSEDYIRSCEEFLKLLGAHESNGETDPISTEIEIQAALKAALARGNISLDRMRPTVALLVYWDRNSERFFVADAVASSKTKSLVSKELGVE